MKDEIRAILERPFTPDQIKQRLGSFGNKPLDYVEGADVIRRLNEGFSGDWEFEIRSHEIREDEVIVLGRITVMGLTREQFGSNKITRNKDDGSVVCMGDDLKSAATDSIKKIASTMGIALDLHRSDKPTKTEATANGAGGNGSKPNENVPAIGGNGNGGTGAGNGGNGNGHGRATAKQVAAIFAIGKSKGMDNAGVKNLIVDHFGRMPEFISKEQASLLIGELSSR